MSVFYAVFFGTKNGKNLTSAFSIIKGNILFVDG